MRAPAEDLQGERRMHTTPSFLKEVLMLVLRIRNSTERRAKTDTDPGLRFVRGKRKSGIFNRQERRGDRKLRVPVEPFQAVWRKITGGVPVADFTATMRPQSACIKSGYMRNPALAGHDIFPERFPAGAATGDWRHSGNHDTAAGRKRGVGHGDLTSGS